MAHHIDSKAPPVAAIARVAIASLFIVSGLAKAFSFHAVAGWIGHVGLPAPAVLLTLAKLHVRAGRPDPGTDVR